MVRIPTGKSLKEAKPVFYCLPEHFGSVADLAQTGRNLQYVTEKGDIAKIWRYLGNPKFRSEYDYLLAEFCPESGDVKHVFAVKVQSSDDESSKRKSCVSMPAFVGTVDKIHFGFAARAQVKHMMEHGFSNAHMETGAPPF
jgi:hypothetical protein